MIVSAILLALGVALCLVAGFNISRLKNRTNIPADVELMAEVEYGWWLMGMTVGVLDVVISATVFLTLYAVS